jgi:hypothetical protein
VHAADIRNRGAAELTRHKWLKSLDIDAGTDPAGADIPYEP